MNLYRIRLNWVIGTGFALLFTFLLILRLGFFQERETEGKKDHALFPLTRPDREIWMNILQKDKKIGYAHRKFYKTIDGYRILESVHMKINVLGMAQDIRFKTLGDLYPNLTLSSFEFELQSGLFRFKARGTVKDNILTFFAGPEGSEQKVDFTIAKDIHLPVGILEGGVSQDLKLGDSRIFQIFDPATTGQRPVKVKLLAEETISIMGRQEKAKKVSVDFMGVSQFAWIGTDGMVLKEEGSFGIRLERVTRKEALQKSIHFGGVDFAEMASIAADKVIHPVDQLKELKLRLDGIEAREVFLDGGRQSLKGRVLTILVESISDLSPRGAKIGIGPDRKRYLEPTSFIQSDHPEIQNKAREIVSPQDSDIIKANKLVAWVNQNIEKRPVLSVPNALDTLRKRVGDCNEHAVLLAALARALGIPAEVEAGLVYQKGRFYYHAWNVLYFNTWVTADSAMGQLPADVTHIRFVRGTEHQIDLMHVIGKVRVEILEVQQR